MAYYQKLNNEALAASRVPKNGIQTDSRYLGRRNMQNDLPGSPEFKILKNRLQERDLLNDFQYEASAINPADIFSAGHKHSVGGRKPGNGH